MLIVGDIHGNNMCEITGGIIYMNNRRGKKPKRGVIYKNNRRGVTWYQACIVLHATAILLLSLPSRPKHGPFSDDLLGTNPREIYDHEDERC